MNFCRIKTLESHEALPTKCDLFVKYHPPSILKEVLICSVCLRRTKDEEISGQGLLRLIFHDKAE